MIILIPDRGEHQDFLLILITDTWYLHVYLLSVYIGIVKYCVTWFKPTRFQIIT